MKLLQLPGIWDLLPGLGSEAAKSQSMLAPLFTWVFFIVSFILLSDVPKIIFRKNIGQRALSIYGIIGSATIYITWGYLLCGIAYYYLSQMQGYPFSYITFLVHPIILVPGGIAYIVLAFNLLLKGMDEHFKAKAQKSKVWQILEYRGDSVRMNKKIRPGFSKEYIWRISEPKYLFKIGIISFLIHPLLGFPILVTSLSFWANEWYHVYFKWVRMQDTYLNMKIEMQKASLFYNQADITEAPFKVTTDD